MLGLSVRVLSLIPISYDTSSDSFRKIDLMEFNRCNRLKLLACRSVIIEFFSVGTLFFRQLDFKLKDYSSVPSHKISVSEPLALLSFAQSILLEVVMC